MMLFSFPIMSNLFVAIHVSNDNPLRTLCISAAVILHWSSRVVLTWYACLPARRLWGLYVVQVGEATKTSETMG